MARYSKYTSTFIKRQEHQYINDGSILERDWTTLGERHVIETGKRRVYGDSGFLFTENSLKSVKKRVKTNEWSEIYTEDSLPTNLTNEVNIIHIPDSQDIRDYAYYGSAVELIRSSLENIVKWFPGKAWATNQHVDYNTEDNTLYLFEIVDNGNHEYTLTFDLKENINLDEIAAPLHKPSIWRIRNPFALDFFQTGKVFGKYDNEMRNLPYSWNRYYVNGCKILSYNSWIKPYDKCDGDYTVIYEATITWETAPSVSRNSEFYDDYNVDGQNVADCVEFTSESNNNIGNDCITFTSTAIKYNIGHIYGLKRGDGIEWCTDVPNLSIMPIPAIISTYFNEIDGFERLLLTTKSNPIYTCTLKTPIKKSNNAPGFLFVNRQYQFPSIGYCIVCDNIAYDKYVTTLYNIATILDEHYTDNIWANMTHEAIKNFDWTYTKDFNDGDDADNIFGGTRMKDVLRIYGRFFDDIKRYIDTIKLNNKITFDGINNLPDAELSDKAQIHGWEVFSTKLYNVTNNSITQEFIDTNVSKKLSRWVPIHAENNTLSLDCDEQPLWFPSISPDGITENSVDNFFMRMLNLSGKNIFRRKGTKHAIEMVYALFGFGNEDFDIEERYYSVTPTDANKIVYVYRKIDDLPVDEYVTIDSSNATTLRQYVYSFGTTLTGNEPKYILLNGEFFELVSYTFKELCEYVNKQKVFTKNYEDDAFSGIPIKEVTLNKKNYIIPYFTQDKLYDGDVQFQTNGGWGKELIYDIETDRKLKYNYMETLPYTTVVQTCAQLLTVNQYDIKDRELFYVMDITDIVDFTESDTSSMSHYFKIIEPSNPQMFSSWSNVPQDSFGTNYEYEEFCNAVSSEGYPVNPLYYGVTYNDYLLTQYNESIILDNTGNNPHTGLGKYDLGENYYNYLTVPFYYSENKYGFNTIDVQLMSEQIRFNVTEHAGDKIVINNAPESEYYLPNKLLIIKQKRNGLTFNSYFKKVLSKYLMQVIPSTTILIFV